MRRLRQDLNHRHLDNLVFALEPHTFLRRRRGKAGEGLGRREKRRALPQNGRRRTGFSRPRRVTQRLGCCGTVGAKLLRHVRPPPSAVGHLRFLYGRGCYVGYVSVVVRVRVMARRTTDLTGVSEYSMGPYRSSGWIGFILSACKRD
jgi:hypothetical protein